MRNFKPPKELAEDAPMRRGLADEQIVASLMRQLSWTHFLLCLKLLKYTSALRARMTNEPKQTIDDKDPLEQAKAILDDLEQALKQKRAEWLIIKKDNPDIEQLSDEHWRDATARSWLHGGTEIFEINELERWDYQKVELSQLSQAKVAPLLSSWRVSVKKSHL